MKECLIPALYLLGIAFIIYKVDIRIAPQITAAWRIPAFLGKVALGCLNYYIWVNVIGHGDSLRYVHDSLIVYNSWFDNPKYFFELISRFSLENIPPHLAEYQKALYIEWHVPEYNMVRLLAVLNLFTGGSAWGNIILISALVYAAEVFLFKNIVRVFNASAQSAKWIFGILFFIPSVIFWSSGLLKEGPVLALLCLVGGITIGLMQKQVFAKSALNIFLLLTMLIVLYGIRNYVAILCLLNLLVLRIVYHRKNIIALSLISSLLIGAIAIYCMHIRTGNFFNYMQSEQSYFLLSGTDPDYTFHTLDGTAGDIIQKTPYALNNILFRPNLLHSSSAFRVYQSAELMLVFAFIIWMLYTHRMHLPDRRVKLSMSPLGIVSLLLFAELLFMYGLMVTDADTLCRYRSVPIMFLLLITYIGTSTSARRKRES